MEVPEKEAAIDRILEAVSEGVSLRKACREEEGINRPTFYKWKEADPELEDRYMRARRMGWACMADELTDIVDQTEPIAEHIQLSKLEVDTKKWIITRMLPNEWGDKQEVDPKSNSDDKLAEVLKKISENLPD